MTNIKIYFDTCEEDSVVYLKHQSLKKQTKHKRDFTKNIIASELLALLMSANKIQKLQDHSQQSFSLLKSKRTSFFKMTMGVQNLKNKTKTCPFTIVDSLK